LTPGETEDTLEDTQTAVKDIFPGGYLSRRLFAGASGLLRDFFPDTPQTGASD
jgi:hypothetical protein